MRILFLTDNFPPETNAPATRTWEHARMWAAKGHDVTVITTAPNFPKGVVYDGYRNAWRTVEQLEGIRVVRVKTYIAANAGTLKRMLDYISFMLSATFFGLFERRPEIIIATSPQFFTACAGFAISILRWRPWVFELRDLWPDSIIAVGAMKPGLALRLVEKLELLLYRRAKIVVSVTSAFRNNLISRGIDGEKIKVVTNGVDPSKFTPAPRDSELAAELNLAGKMVVGYVGTHGMAHALDSVMDAAELLAGRDDIAFLFVGDGAERSRLEQRANGMPNVRLLGSQPRDRMPAIWSICDVALVPLRNTPTFRTVIPSKIFEAMAMGRPILMSLPKGEATGIIDSDQTGLTIAPENPAEMASAIRRLADDSDLRARLGANGASAVRKYDRSVLADAMLNHLIAAANQ
ncbi:MAG: glycosyltransferase family 4 protein [Pseudomonadota bacterium]